MDSLIVLAVVVLIVGAAIGYIRKEKRKGIQCVGCPDAKRCAAGGCCTGCAGNQRKSV